MLGSCFELNSATAYKLLSASGDDQKVQEQVAQPHDPHKATQGTVLSSSSETALIAAQLL